MKPIKQGFYLITVANMLFFATTQYAISKPPTELEIYNARTAVSYFEKDLTVDSMKTAAEAMQKVFNDGGFSWDTKQIDKTEAEDPFLTMTIVPMLGKTKWLTIKFKTFAFEIGAKSLLNSITLEFSYEDCDSITLSGKNIEIWHDCNKFELKGGKFDWSSQQNTNLMQSFINAVLARKHKESEYRTAQKKVLDEYKQLKLLDAKSSEAKSRAEVIDASLKKFLINPYFSIIKGPGLFSFGETMPIILNEKSQESIILAGVIGASSSSSIIGYHIIEKTGIFSPGEVKLCGYGLGYYNNNKESIDKMVDFTQEMDAKFHVLKKPPNDRWGFYAIKAHTMQIRGEHGIDKFMKFNNVCKNLINDFTMPDEHWATLGRSLAEEKAEDGDFKRGQKLIGEILSKMENNDEKDKIKSYNEKLSPKNRIDWLQRIEPIKRHYIYCTDDGNMQVKSSGDDLVYATRSELRESFFVFGEKKSRTPEPKTLYFLPLPEIAPNWYFKVDDFHNQVRNAKRSELVNLLTYRGARTISYETYSKESTEEKKAEKTDVNVDVNAKYTTPVGSISGEVCVETSISSNFKEQYTKRIGEKKEIEISPINIDPKDLVFYYDEPEWKHLANMPVKKSEWSLFTSSDYGLNAQQTESITAKVNADFNAIGGIDASAEINVGIASNIESSYRTSSESLERYVVEFDMDVVAKRKPIPEFKAREHIPQNVEETRKHIPQEIIPSTPEQTIIPQTPNKSRKPRFNF